MAASAAVTHPLPQRPHGTAAPVAAIAVVPVKVFFEVGQIVLNDAGKKTVIDFAEAMKKDGTVVAEITGYTDQTGDIGEEQGDRQGPRQGRARAVQGRGDRGKPRADATACRCDDG